LGPRAMLKMLLDPMGGIVLTNDGNAILREIDVGHPAAKSMLELCRSQDEEVGDGTTGVIILAGEVLGAAMPFLERNVHPIQLIRGYKRALEVCLQALDEEVSGLTRTIDPLDDKTMLSLVATCLGTKLASRWSGLACQLALDAVRTVTVATPGAAPEIDIKRFVRIEKIPGGEMEESRLVRGVVLNKDVVHPGMRRHIERPRILLLDCSLEYKKGESETSIEVSRDGDWARYLAIEEEQIRGMCDAILAVRPDVVLTEKGVSDLAQHFLLQAGISCIRRIKKSDANRLARATGATIVHRVEDLKEADVGCDAGVFRVDKIGDEYFVFVEECVVERCRACTILLRGPSRDILQELDRNLADALAVARNVVRQPRLCPGGGATEMALAVALERSAGTGDGPVDRMMALALAAALEVIPRTLVQNCGGDPVRLLTQLKAKHAADPVANAAWGIDGVRGRLVDMAGAEEDWAGANEDAPASVWEPVAVKVQALKTAIEAACMILRVDDIVSGIAKKGTTPGSSEGVEDAPQAAD
jgi:T-complex protein 1 subunit gamma